MFLTKGALDSKIFGKFTHFIKFNCKDIPSKLE